MMNLLFSPTGRIAPSQYMRGMIILGVVAAVLALLPLLSMTLGTIAGLLGFVLFYCVIALGIKRSHDAGKSGWWSIAHILLFLLVSTALTWILLTVFGLSMGDMFRSAAGGDVSAVEEFTQASIIPSAIATLLTYPITAFLVNMLNPHDPTPNQYGNIVDGATFD